MDRTISGMNRSVHGIACAGIALVVAMTMASSARAQGAVTPSGDGTEVSPYQITELGNLVWMGDNVGSSSGKYYTVQNDINASATAGWNSGAGFAPIGTNTPFMGIFNGNSNKISNLNIYRPGQDGVGLFASVGGSGLVKNLGLSGVSVTGRNSAGGLAGMIYGGTVNECYVTGSVAGTDSVGGLAGWIYGGTVSKCYATASVTGNNTVGGLAGGIESGSTVSGCYATGLVTGNSTVGGLVGSCNDWNSTVSGCYAAGQVTGSGPIGGLVGYLGGGSVSFSYWDTNTTGQATSAGGGFGKTTTQMKQQATFVGWNFTTVWRITENVTYPLLRLSFSRPTGLPWMNLLLGQ